MPIGQPQRGGVEAAGVDVAHDPAEIHLVDSKALHLTEADLLVLLFKPALFDVLDRFPVQPREADRSLDQYFGAKRQHELGGPLGEAHITVKVKFPRRLNKKGQVTLR